MSSSVLSLFPKSHLFFFFLPFSAVSPLFPCCSTCISQILSALGCIGLLFFYATKTCNTSGFSSIVNFSEYQFFRHFLLLPLLFLILPISKSSAVLKLFSPIEQNKNLTFLPCISEYDTFPRDHKFQDASKLLSQKNLPMP